MAIKRLCTTRICVQHDKPFGARCRELDWSENRSPFPQDSFGLSWYDEDTRWFFAGRSHCFEFRSLLWPPSMTAVSPESLPRHGGSLRFLPEKMVASRLWPVCLRRATNYVSHRQFLSADKAGWWLVQAALCRWWCCCVADQLWRPMEDVTWWQQQLLWHQWLGDS